MSVELRDVLQRVQRVQRAGAGYLGRCPAHEDRHASLSIAAGARVPVVLNCKAGCSFDDIVASLGFDKGALTHDATASDAASRPAARPSNTPSAAYIYRNADGSVFGWKERFVSDVGGKTFRWSRPDPSTADRRISGTGNGDIPLYRLPELIGAPAEEIVLVVEGEKDSDRLAALGFVVTTTPNGASTKWRDADSGYFAGRRVCVIADDDEPGRKKAADTAAALRNVASAVGVVTLPNPNRIKGFDSSDFLDAGGTVADFKRAIEAFDAPKLPPEIVPGDELRERVLALWETGDEPGVYPGWEKLKHLYRPRLGELTIVTGAPNAGKSTFLDDFALRVACGEESPSGEQSAGWRWLVYSAEQFPPQRHASKLLQKLLSKPFNEGPTARMGRDEIRAAWPLIDRHFTILDPSFIGCNLDRILEVGHEVNATRGIEGLILDPYNVISATSRTKAESEHEFINETLAKLRIFAQSERIHVVIVAHPTKLKRESDEAEYPVPRPWDISGSGHWYNHADAIVCVWRAMRDQERVDRGEVEIHVQKIRFQPECGLLGMARLYFDRVTSRFLEEPRGGVRHQLAPWEAA